jgi:hypothetical protein
MTIYPNPNAGSFFLEVEDYDGPFDIVVRDILGKPVLSSQVVPNSAGQRELTLTGAAPGLYLVTVRGGAVEQTLKMIRESAETEGPTHVLTAPVYPFENH